MKKTVIILCVGMMIGWMAGVTSGAYAAVGDKVEAIFSEFNIFIDGEEQTLDAMPLVYNGTSYLPLRTLANLVGKDVTYLADTKTIELNTPSTVTDEVYGDAEATEMIFIEPTEEEKRMSLEEIDANIERLQRMIQGNVVVMGSTDDSEQMAIMETQNAQWKAEIAELEAQKAVLAQTETTP